jgi:nucleoside 2-deoxyribosyltransferase
MGHDLSATEIYQKDMAWIDEADVIVAEVTQPSLGVGYEIGYATQSLKKPVLALYRPHEGRRLSAMIGGCDLVTNHEYQTIDEIKPILDTFFATR